MRYSILAAKHCQFPCSKCRLCLCRNVWLLARTAPLIPEIHDIDFIKTESEVDALLLEARLIKDIQPKYNRDLKDSKTFPYLQIRMREPACFPVDLC